MYSGAATHWTGESAYWDHVDQGIVTNMVNQGLTALTGAGTVADAWRSLILQYQTGRKIAIKVSFNNSQDCGSNGNAIDGIIEPINAVVAGLKQIGVHGDDIWIYDASRALPNRFVSRGPTDVHYFDNGCHENAGWSNQNITFHPPSGGSVATETLPEVLVNASYLINMPIMKAHPIGGVSLGYKNHFGTINAPGDLHVRIDAVSGTSRTDYNPMVDFYRDPHIGGKTVLTIGDGLFAATQFNQPPQVWETFGYQVPNSLFFATDPVAVDCVMHDFVAAEVTVPAEANRYLRLAAAAGQGVFERGNPWASGGSGYTSIDYRPQALSTL